MTNPYRQLEDALGYRFRKPQHLEMALTHRSYRYESSDPKPDNQRLEYLGDAVLGLAASERLYEICPDVQEGELTRRRSLLCNRRALARIAQVIGLGRFLRLGRGEEQTGGRDRASTLGDALEAVLGAAYLDGGLKAVRTIFDRLFSGLLDHQEEESLDENPKGALQEYCQRVLKTSPTYDLLEESGPAHARIFTAGVYIGARLVATGTAPGKREAEMQAALQALNRKDELSSGQAP